MSAPHVLVIGAVFALFALVSNLVAAQTHLPPVEELPSVPELNDPFLTFEGERIDTPEVWIEKRRPELKRLFQHYMYGYLPATPIIEVEVESVYEDALDGKALLKQIAITLGGDEEQRIHLLVIVPKDADGPVPVFLGLNRCGNHTVIADPRVRLDNTIWRHDHCDDERGTRTDFWSVEYLLERGYGFATFHESDIDPDKHDFTDGVHARFTDPDVPEASRWGTIAAWAWGLHRGLDYLVTDPDVDAEKICLIGHSRRGKTSLFAAAMDERVALVVPHQSGTGGAALSRDNDQETIERINRVFPHWFNDLFTQFNDREDRLPFDQHLLMALVAPRPLLDTAGLQDTWANYESGLRGAREADRVYKFLGARGAVGDGLIVGPQRLSAENCGSLLQYRLDTKHELNRDYWQAILDFADLQFGRVLSD